MLRPNLHKKSEVYDLIVERLVEARYAFGEPILVKELATELGVSRQPIMTALGRLDADGFVRIVPQVGCQVVDPGSNEIADFYLMFQRMEGLLAELAATRHNEAQIRELREQQRRILSAQQDPEVLREHYAELNRGFHQIIHNMAHSPLLDEKQRANFNMSDFFINQSVGFGAFVHQAVEEHEDIIAAIAGGNAKRARALSEAHIHSVAKSVLAGIAAREAAGTSGGGTRSARGPRR
jgi:DNA-binding GntR family transcriptional regulator